MVPFGDAQKARTLAAGASVIYKQGRKDFTTFLRDAFSYESANIANMSGLSFLSVKESAAATNGDKTGSDRTRNAIVGDLVMVLPTARKTDGHVKPGEID